MSTREIQDIIFQPCILMFRDGMTRHGMIVARYDIGEARIQYYFIPGSSLEDYHNARQNHDLFAHKRLGKPIDAGTIIKADIIN